MITRFEGVYAAMVTPFSDDGKAVSTERMNGYIDFLVDRGVNGIFALGTTGEWPLLTTEERIATTRDLVAMVNHRVPLIVHCGANGTETAIELCRCARTDGVDAVSIVSPSYYELDPNSIVEHFVQIAESVKEMAVFLYNIPSCTGNEITPDIAAQVAGRCANVVGLKYSGDDIVRFRAYRKRMGDEFHLFGGNDSLALLNLHAGASGLVSGNASAYPEVLVSLYRAFASGDVRRAEQIQLSLDRIIEEREEISDLSVFKNILRTRGIPVGDVRKPLNRVSSTGLKALKEMVAALTGSGLIHS